MRRSPLVTMMILVGLLVGLLALGPSGCTDSGASRPGDPGRDGSPVPIGAQCEPHGRPCETGSECRGGVCVQVSPKGGRCEVEADCQTGLTCVDGRCAIAASHGQGCDPGQWLLCDEGLQCREGRCWFFAGEGGQCDEIRAMGCLEGLACVQGRCVQRARVGEACGPGSQGLRPCMEGLLCHEGRCVEVAQAGEPCPEGEPVVCVEPLDCVESTCVRVLGEGGDCSDPSRTVCGEGLVCEDGRCRAGSSPGAECRADDDCREGTRCLDGMCRTVLSGGDPCDPASQERWCDLGLTCLDGVCVALVGAGGDCRGPGARCDEGLGCVDGRCVVLVPPGGDCAAGGARRCMEGLECVRDRCVELVGPGGDCTDELTTRCDVGLGCYDGLCKDALEPGLDCSDPTSTVCLWPAQCLDGLCRTWALEGGDCSDPTTTRCTPPTICVEGVCQAAPGVGELCDQGDACPEGLDCVDGRCSFVVAAGGACPDPVTTRCEQGLECLDGVCRDVRGPGEACAASSGVVCREPLRCLGGRCRRVVPAGAGCGDQDTTVCEEGTSCVDGLCRVPRGLGEPCGDRAREACIVPLVCSQGRCVELVGQGGDCSDPSVSLCDSGLVCRDGRCVRLVAPGEACDLPGTMCRPDSRCAEGTCRKLLGPGQDCSRPDSTMCGGDLRCVDGVCVSLAGRGEACGPAAVCEGELVCHEGTCRVELGPGDPCGQEGSFCREPYACQEGVCDEVRGEPGAMCGDDVGISCADGLECSGGLCRARLSPGDDCRDPDVGFCDEGTMCLEGRCRVILPEGEDCSDPGSTACGLGLVCVEGRCSRTLVAGQDCSDPARARCGDDLVCVEGRCRVPVPPGGACDGQWDVCTSGATCREGVCVLIRTLGQGCSAPHTLCVGGSVRCHDGVCLEALAIGDDCSNPALGFCAEGRCLGGRCVEVAGVGERCSGDSLCEEGAVCRSGRCVVPEGGDCGDHPDGCEAGTSCHQGVCVAPRGPGEPCGPCRDGLTCRDGLCKAEIGPGGSCEDHAATFCAAGLVCGHDNGLLNGYAGFVDVCVEPGCGDGIVQEGEDCDDGNPDDTDGCTNDCHERVSCPEGGHSPGHPAYCSAACPCSEGLGDCDGDAQCVHGLVCGTDNGPRFGFAADVDVCVVPGCGDGVVQDGEDCDDGNLDDTDGCLSDCTMPCDRGGLAPGDEGYCTPDCPCGRGEGACASDDGCLPGLVCGVNDGERFGLPPGTRACTEPGCGDGLDGPFEVCDDGDLDDLDGCTSTCLPTCPPEGEVPGSAGFCTPACPCPEGKGDCDRAADCLPGLVCGADNGARFGFPASLDVCVRPGCGDGIVQEGEDCDDGNLDDTDGCLSDCTTRIQCPPPGMVPGQADYCSVDCPCPEGAGDCDRDSECAPGLVCGHDNGARFGLDPGVDVCVVPGCGDGMVQDGEDCDDGNLDDTDGCLSDCTTPVHCPPEGLSPGEPGYCTVDCPCPEGVGPCDSPEDCQVGLVCGEHNGARYGLPRDMRVCAPPGCGDGVPLQGEACDDGNLDDTDGCLSDCTLPCRDVAVILLADGRRLVIDRYEASRPDATMDSEGVSSERACSRPGVVPWTHATYEEAVRACDAAGGHLCTREEWEAACMGPTLERNYPYGDYWISGACNGYRGTENQLAGTGEFLRCSTPDGVYDLVGNLFEWIASDDPEHYVRGGSYRLTALAVSQRLDSCWAEITVAPGGEDLGFRCCGAP